MSAAIQSEISRLFEHLNRSDFDGFVAMLDEDCVLDMPGGARVIGRDSVRDTLSAWLIERKARFEDIVVMTDLSGQRGAAEMTLALDNAGERSTVPAVLLFERDGAGMSRISFYGNLAG